MTGIELFCGAGGLSLGLRRAGVEMVLGVDCWQPALDVYQGNLGHDVLLADLSRGLPRGLPRVDLVCGGPPCQAFSHANRRRKDDPRGWLVVAFAEEILRLRPRLVLMENVSPAPHRPCWQIAKGLLKTAYGLTEILIDAAYYGVPQYRRRVFLIGRRGGKDGEFLERLLAGASERPLTIRQYCGQGVGVEYFFRHPRWPGNRGVFSIDEPSPCVTCEYKRRTIGPGYRPHPDDAIQDLSQVRCLTSDEASLIQTFPQWWNWGDLPAENLWTLIGNAVPPVLAEHIGRALLAEDARASATIKVKEDWQILQGDCRQVLGRVRTGTVQCCVTSPPYWGLRDYRAGEGEIGREATIAKYIAELVAVFRLVRDCLSDDGTCWLVMGDAYAGSSGYSPDCPSNGNGGLQAGKRGNPPRMPLCGLPKKNLIGLPWRVALALQADGWILRADVVWHKPNATPESVRDRPTRGHEYAFLLAKGAQYYYDQDAVREPLADATPARMETDRRAREKYGPDFGGRVRGGNSHNGRNRRTVWDIPVTHPVGSHSAAFPVALATTCILAGSRLGDLILDPFSGSATTGVAALRLGRRYLGVELSPQYCEEARRRLAEAGLD